MSPRHKSTRPVKRPYKDFSPSDDGLPQPAPKCLAASPNGRSSKQYGVTLENWAENGGASSQQILQAFQRTRRYKKTEFLSKFRETLSEQRAEIGNMCAEIERQLAEEDAEFIAALKAQIQIGLELPSTTSTKASHHGDPTIAASKHPLNQHAALLFALSTQLVDKHNQACHLVREANPKETLGETWEDDRETLADLLQIGHRVAARQINGELSKSRKSVEEKPLSVEEEKENQVAESYFGFKTQDRKNITGLKEVLAYAERGVDLITTALPTGED